MAQECWEEEEEWMVVDVDDRGRENMRPTAPNALVFTAVADGHVPDEVKTPTRDRRGRTTPLSTRAGDRSTVTFTKGTNSPKRNGQGQDFDLNEDLLARSLALTSRKRPSSTRKSPGPGRTGQPAAPADNKRKLKAERGQANGGNDQNEISFRDAAEVSRSLSMVSRQRAHISGRPTDDPVGDVARSMSSLTSMGSFSRKPGQKSTIKRPVKKEAIASSPSTVKLANKLKKPVRPLRAKAPPARGLPASASRAGLGRPSLPGAKSTPNLRALQAEVKQVKRVSGAPRKPAAVKAPPRPLPHKTPVRSKSAAPIRKMEPDASKAAPAPVKKSEPEANKAAPAPVKKSEQEANKAAPAPVKKSAPEANKEAVVSVPKSESEAKKVKEKKKVAPKPKAAVAKREKTQSQDALQEVVDEPEEVGEEVVGKKQMIQEENEKQDKPLEENKAEAEVNSVAVEESKSKAKAKPKPKPIPKKKRKVYPAPQPVPGEKSSIESPVPPAPAVVRAWEHEENENEPNQLEDTNVHDEPESDADPGAAPDAEPLHQETDSDIAAKQDISPCPANEPIPITGKAQQGELKDFKARTRRSGPRGGSRGHHAQSAGHGHGGHGRGQEVGEVAPGGPRRRDKGAGEHRGVVVEAKEEEEAGMFHPNEMDEMETWAEPEDLTAFRERKMEREKRVRARLAAEEEKKRKQVK